MQVNLRKPWVFAAVLAAVASIVGGAFSIGMALGEARRAGEPPGGWIAELSKQEAQIDDVRRVLQENVNALAARVGQMNASVIRLDALGKRLTRMAKLRDGEFDFGNPPAVGGADSIDAQPAQIPNLTAMIDALQAQLASREQQLGVLENLILARELDKQVYPEGRPVPEGWISSYFGSRQDPFTGFVGRHRGVDFAGPEGTKVSAVAAGVVIYAGERAGCGQMVEVNHGNGLSTRYCHNEVLLVKQGDMVRKGQKVSLMGSTGHSTGPHLHFEVLKDGAPVDPLRFIAAER
ncbi:MAG: M23 family metallopeptidase [Pseudomonadota bacterium]|nr:M23 family metallopeptidase [Pseudomonadota bacterium]